MDKKHIKLTLFCLWLLLIGGAIYLYFKLNIPLSEYLTIIRDFIVKFGVLAPIIYIIVYTIRPLIFFPATLLTTLSGVLFGPFWGVIYTVIGENLSANVSFIVGRYFGKDVMGKMTGKTKLTYLMECKFRDNGFTSVLIMRLIYIPFDLVGYLAGACDLRQIDFALATFVGIIPGIITFVLLGSAWTDPRNLIISGIFFVLGLIISKYLKKRGDRLGGE
jgi:uncharacterized membrane protein YdjX (TVP38/TMEM64 family)